MSENFDTTVLSALVELLRNTFEGEPWLQNVVNSLNTTRNLETTVDSVFADDGDDVPTRLQLLVELFALSNRDVSAIEPILTDQSVTSVLSASKYYLTLSNPEFRGRLFFAAPTGVLSVLIEAETVPVDPEIREYVLQILQVAVENGFNMNTDPIREFISPSNASDIPEKDRDAVLHFFKSLYRVQTLVEAAEDVKYLLGTPFTSAYEIARTERSGFLSMMSSRGMQEEKALKLYDHATTIETRNEQSWITMLRSRQTWTVAVLDGKGETDGAKRDKGKRAKPSETMDITFANIFSELETAECDHCVSVLSPAAYFVDLLQFLGTSRINKNDVKSPSVLTKLFDRRPDLRHLELSCPNTNYLVPYIDLANEVMESYVQYLDTESAEDRVPIKPFNVSEKDGHDTDGQAVQPANINYSVYQDYIQPQVYPMDLFPYNQAVDSVRAYAKALESSRYEILSTFQSEYRVLRTLSSRNDTNLLPSPNSAARVVIERAIAAEYLGLQHEDYVCITHESFYPPTLLGLNPEDYAQHIHLNSPGEYWGYSLDELMIDEDSKSGLQLVLTQLLPRAGISFSELISILKTRFLSYRLTLQTTSTNPREFYGTIATLRLRKPFPTSSGHTLDVSVCDDLQRFIRLWRKIGWSIAETDAAIVCLSPSTEEREYTGIIPAIIEGMAAIKELSAITNQTVSALLPLWGNIHDELYSHLFLQRQILARDSVFAADDQGRVLSQQPPERMSEHKEALLASLRLSPGDFDAIESATKISDDSDPELTVASVSLLYRVKIFCKILGIRPQQYPSFLSLHAKAENFNPFLTPVTTLKVVKSWKELFATGWSAAQLLNVTGAERAGSDERKDLAAAFKACIALAAGFADIEKSFQGFSPVGRKFPNENATEDAIRRFSMELFDPVTAEAVCRFIEGSLQVTQTVDTVKDAKGLKIEIPEHLRSKVSYRLSSASADVNVLIWSITLTATGILSKEEYATLEKLVPDYPEWLTLLEGLDRASKAVYENQIAPLFDTGKSEQDAQQLFTRSTPGSTTGTETSGSSVGEALLQAEENLIERRIKYIQAVLPRIRARQMQQLILDVVNSQFSSTDASIIHVLLTDILVGGMETLLGVQYVNMAAFSGKTFDGHFLPSSTDVYRFHVRKNSITEAPVRCTVDGVPLQFVADGQYWSSPELRYTKGQTYKLHLDLPINLVKWSTQHSTPSAFANDMLIDSTTIDGVRDIYARLVRIVTVLSVSRLNLEELQFMKGKPGNASTKSSTHTNNGIAIDFGSITLNSIERLATYTTVRDSWASAENGSLLGFLKWASRGDDDQYPNARITSITGWPATQVKGFLAAKYPGLSGTEIAGLFCDGAELASMKRAIDLIERLGIPSVTPEALFKWAQPVPENLVVTDFENAAEMRLLAHSLPGLTSQDSGTDSVLTAANDTLRSNRRGALVGYLLQQPSIRQLGLKDADSLFEHFLIDVKMGAALKTSRIKQAISTVQVYVLRCLQGLEKDKPIKGQGVPSTTINQDRWAWMNSYRVWEANRKVFLYPENWIDPTLRDDKTELFKTFESTIMQHDLNQEYINDAVKSYIYSANDIADLVVETYFYDLQPDDRRSCHFFARTRTAPYVYYYRRVQLAPDSKGVTTTRKWDPWRRMDIDIPVQEVQIDGNRTPRPGSYLIPALFKGRLYLFMPQITRKSTQNKEAMDMSLRAMGDSTPNQAAVKVSWEIRLGWSEYRSGRWSPKQLSEATLDVRAAAVLSADQITKLTSRGKERYDAAILFPDITSFRFSVRQRNADVLVIDVHRWINDSGRAVVVETSKESIKFDKMMGSRYTLGSFEFRASQLSFSSAGAFAPTVTDWNTESYWLPTPCTQFSKFSQKMLATKLPDSGFMDGDKPAQIALIDNITTGNDVTWTMTFDYARYDRAMGHVVDIDNGQKSQSFFAIPQTWKWAPGTNETLIYDVFSHTLSPHLMQVATMTDGIDDTFKTISGISDELWLDVFGLRNGPIYHELSTPYALYNWELGVFMVMMLMERLLATQQFSLALEVAHNLFDPRAGGDDIARCWKFPPFRNEKLRTQESVAGQMKNLESSAASEEHSTINQTVSEWRDNPFNPYSIARGRPVTYMKRIVMKYIEILIASGDQYFRQNTLETLPLAIQQYIQASHIFGPAPQRVPKLGKTKVKTYAQFASLNDFSNASVELELEFPFFSPPSQRGSTAGIGDKFQSGLFGFVKSSYFCVPTNPRLVELRDTIDDRLYKIRNSMDINGNVRTLALYEPAIDPGMLVRAVASGQGGLGLSILLNDINSPMPNYRFNYLLHKAFELCAELKSMQALFLAAKEKRDTESMMALRTTHEGVIMNLTMDMKQKQKEEAGKAIEVLRESRKSHESKLVFFLALAGAKGVAVPGEDQEWTDIQQSIEAPTDDELKMTSHEKLDMDTGTEASNLQAKAATLDNSASFLLALPGFSTNIHPWGLGMSMKLDAGNVAQFQMALASGMKSDAQRKLEQGNRAGKKALLIRQLQDRRFQANMAARDIKNTDKQIATQKGRVAVCDSDIKIQEQHIAHSTQTMEWLKSKYTNEQLYAWMDNSVRSLFYQTYLLTSELAKKVEKAFRFERCTDDVDYLQSAGYWDSARDGLLSAENLYLGLKRMEMAHISKRAHDFEIVKSISIRQVDPWALLSLRETGTARFSLPEALFDMDFPGHYCRRIRSVSVSIPCILSPYTSVNSTLTLLSHKYRVKGTSSNYPESTEAADSDSRFRTDPIPISSVAVSTAHHDSGVFELNFHDERYLPFEGAGAISEWRLEIPSVARQFDYNTISDVLLQLRYTALNGGLALRSAAAQEVSALQSSAEAGRCFALLDVKNDYANEWHSFLQDGKITMKAVRDRLPYWTRSRSVIGQQISVVLDVGGEAVEDVDLQVGDSDVTMSKSVRKLGKLKVFEGKEGVEKGIRGSLTLGVKVKEGVRVDRLWMVLQYTVEESK